MSKEKEEKGKKNNKGKGKSKSFFTDERIKFVFGILITGFALYLLLACVAYLFWWKTDQSLPDSETISGADVNVKNWSGKSGHFLAKMIIGYGFGYGAFFIPLIFGALGLYLLNFPKLNLWKLITKFTFAAIIISLLLGFIFGEAGGYLISGPGGAQGFEITRWLNSFMGKIGTGILLALMTVSYLIFALRFKPETFTSTIPSTIKNVIPGFKTSINASEASEMTDETDSESDDDEPESEPEEGQHDKEIKFTV
ncbi:MAG: DNA translocase FtsK 4TM domain-containing protein, partial [Bacteroidales bacterium]